MAFSAASRMVSVTVGWEWMVEISSSTVASRRMASAPSEMRSVARGPMMFYPSSSPYLASQMIFTRPSPPLMIRALPLALMGNLPTL